jgi:hypothetical protein
MLSQKRERRRALTPRLSRVASKAADAPSGTAASKSSTTDEAAARCRTVAFHEAAHAVAFLHIGRASPAIRISARGSGITWGKVDVRCSPDGVRDFLMCILAGPLMESIIGGRSLDELLEGGGIGDAIFTRELIAWLVKRGHARSRRVELERAHVSALTLIGTRFDAIERVARALGRSGRLTSRQVRALASCQ